MFITSNSSNNITLIDLGRYCCDSVLFPVGSISLGSVATFGLQFLSVALFLAR